MERSRLPSISELMKRELDSNPWCRVSGSREGSTTVRSVGARGRAETGVCGEKKGEIENEGCATRGSEKPDQFIY